MRGLARWRLGPAPPRLNCPNGVHPSHRRKRRDKRGLWHPKPWPHPHIATLPHATTTAAAAYGYAALAPLDAAAALRGFRPLTSSRLGLTRSSARSPPPPPPPEGFPAAMSGLSAPPFDGLASGPDPWDVVVKVILLLVSSRGFVSPVRGLRAREGNRF